MIKKMNPMMDGRALIPWKAKRMSDRIKKYKLIVETAAPATTHPDLIMLLYWTRESSVTYMVNPSNVTYENINLHKRARKNLS